MRLPLISVIIVTYNSANYLPECLKSLFQTKYNNVEIIVVDNNSKDNTVNVINSFKEKLIPLLQDKNLGYAEGNNLGIRKARGEFAFLLNPDTLVDKNIFTFLLKTFEVDSKIAACQPVVYLMKQPKLLNLTGMSTHFMGFSWVRDYNKSTLPKSGEIMSFSGCGVMIKKTVFEKVQAFDSDYFMYYEDSDLSWRLHLFGFKLVFVPEAIMYHDYKYIPVESYQALKNKLFFNERNRIMTIYKNYSTKTIILLLPAAIFLEFCMLVFSLFGGWFKEKVRGYVSIIKLRRTLNHNRVFVQKNRILSDKQIANNFMSKLNVEIYNNWGVRLFANPFLYCYWRVVKKLI